MTVNLATIDHGEANWDAKQNANFKALNQDTGWQDVQLSAPVTGTLKYRLRNGQLLIQGTLQPNESADKDGLYIGSLPTNLISNSNYESWGWSVPVSGSVWNTNTARIAMHDNFKLFFYGDNGPLDNYVSLNIVIPE